MRELSVLEQELVAGGWASDDGNFEDIGAGPGDPFAPGGYLWTSMVSNNNSNNQNHPEVTGTPIDEALYKMIDTLSKGGSIGESNYLFLFSGLDSVMGYTTPESMAYGGTGYSSFLNATRWDAHNTDGHLLDGTSHLEYHQSTGEMYGVAADGTKTLLGTGYSGDKDHYNDPSAENLKGEGPLPKGYYDLGGVTRSVGPNTIILNQWVTNETYDRDLFRIHGDNIYLNHTASEGCIVLGPGVRSTIINGNYSELAVVE